MDVSQDFTDSPRIILIKYAIGLSNLYVNIFFVRFMLIRNIQM